MVNRTKVIFCILKTNKNIFFKKKLFKFKGVKIYLRLINMNFFKIDSYSLKRI